MQHIMTAGDLYRKKAAEFLALAKEETAPHLQAEYTCMAASYFRLAELADKNNATRLEYFAPADA
jgi:hypothetical protein